MRWILLGLWGGCAYIPAEEHQEKLDALSDGGEPATTADLPALAPRVDSVEPAVIAGCAQAAEIAVVASVDGAWIGEELEVAWQLNGGAVTPAGRVEVVEGPGSRGRVALTASGVTCAAAPCDLAVAVGPGEGATPEASDPYAIEVVTEPVPAPVEIEVYDAVLDAWFDLSTLQTLAQASARHAVLQSRFQQVRVGFVDPLHGTPWAASTASPALVACPEAVDPFLEPSLCAFSSAEALADPETVHPTANLAYAFDLAPVAEHVCGTEESRAAATWDYYLVAVDHACAPDVSERVEAVTVRVVLDDCDADAVDVAVDCDDDDPTRGLPSDWYPDSDGDGHGAEGATPTAACDQPPLTAALADDCDDARAATFPGAPEICNAIDDDCDPLTTEDGLVARSGLSEPSLEVALDNAIDGDEIVLCAGTHFGPAVVDGMEITIRGMSRDAVIQGGPSGPAVGVLFGGSVVLQTLTITGGSGASAGGGTEGGGVHASNADTVTLDDVALVGNTAGLGGGLSARDTVQVAISNSEIRSNVATGEGGGLHVLGALELTDVVVELNTAAHGGGAAGGGIWTLTDSTFQYNDATDGGGGLSATVPTSDLLLTRVTFLENTANLGGGLHQTAGTLTVNGTSFSGNSAGSVGGGLHVVETALSLDGGSIQDNDAVGSGGGLSTFSSDGVSIVGTSFSGNSAGLRGGGIHLDSSTSALLDGVTLELGDAADGGGMAVFGSDVTLTSCLVTDNQASMGGGGVSVLEGDLVLDGTSLSANSADLGAAVHLDRGSVETSGLSALHGNIAQVGDASAALHVVEGTVTLAPLTGTGVGPTDNVPNDLLLSDDRFPVTQVTRKWDGPVGVYTVCSVENPGDSPTASCTP